MHTQTIRELIEQGLPGAKVTVQGDGRHFEALVESPLFSGKSMVARHQMVYRALGDKMREEIHALSIRAVTPDEPGAGSGH
ncbi:MAG: BolA family protein [Acidiferrobacteraceae bacterium]